MKIFFSNRGQSLLEAVVGTALVTLVLTGLISALTYSLSNTQNSRSRALATKYAQEAVEWLREERDKSWSDFYSRATDTETEYCLVFIGSWPAEGTCASNDYIPGTNMRREIVLDGNGLSPPTQNQDRVDITVKVTFPQGANLVDVTINTSLTKW